jgi:hypothetical protein
VAKFRKILVLFGLSKAQLNNEIFSMSRAIIVLGMHRSGTSAVAGGLGAAGMFMGRGVNQKAPGNEKGLQEKWRVVILHEHLLESNGGTWYNPPPKIKWMPLHRFLRDRIIKGHVDKEIWGFKDPRTLLTLPGWLDALPNAELIGIFRNPVAVANSLNKRKTETLPSVSKEKGLELWNLYNERLLSIYEKSPFPLLSFDKDGESFKADLLKAMHLLKLPRPSSALDFFEDDLRSADKVKPEAEFPISEKTLEIYERLKKIAL